MKYALVGNQNCGKTTLFNQLTGSNQHVGNFPGVTVDQKIGVIKNMKDSTIVDLPGIYSIRPYSSEEIVTRDFILKQKPDAILNIVDATNIERNLYLTLQLLEMRLPMVIALNMMDEVENNGGTIDVKKLSEEIGVPVVPISAAKKQGLDDLTKTMSEVATKKILPAKMDFCSGAVHRSIHSVCHIIEDHAEACSMSPRFVTSSVIQGDEDIVAELNLDENEKELIEHTIVQMEKEMDLDRNEALADMRYTFIEKVVSEAVKKKATKNKERIRSEKIDKVLTNKWLAIPTFIGIMLLIFYLSFDLIGGILTELLGKGIDELGVLTGNAMASAGINPVVTSLVVNGVFAGVGSVLSFLPVIVILFFFLSILEDTGYMARIAFVMDKLLRKIGLSGRSIVPMLIGFGCSVPAVMSTRTLSSNRDRKMTIFLTPYMSCSAKIPIYLVFTMAFFPKYRALVMMGLYLLGIVVGILISLIFKKTVYKGNPTPFLMELPNYRMPSVKSVLLLMWEKAKDFIKKAFTIIFLASLVIWFLQTFDYKFNVVESIDQSLLGIIGKGLAPIFYPLGITDWRVSTSLIAGISAKEAVVSTLAVLMGTSVSELSGVLATVFSPLTAFAFLVFTLLYTPCIAAVTTIGKELGSRWWTLAVIVFQCVVAWVVSFVIYRLGLLIQGGGLNAIDYVVISLIMVLAIVVLAYILHQKKKGANLCSGDCSSCNKSCKK
ncbi:MAG: ferrous iron transport protein B [Clostridia bacterium]|nr:ferrous iron transport protein B [Clostridia bacterium]MDY5263924.1 ferrous iron transport protein B [Eubacteriales bacterium]